MVPYEGSWRNLEKKVKGYQPARGVAECLWYNFSLKLKELATREHETHYNCAMKARWAGPVQMCEMLLVTWFSHKCNNQQEMRAYLGHGALVYKAC
jgi:hypothetical protein